VYRYQKWLIVAGVFLAVALILPIYFYAATVGNTSQAPQNVSPDWTSYFKGTGPIYQFLTTQSAAQMELLLVAAVGEVVVVVAFAVTMWYAIKCRSKDLCVTYPNPTPSGP
jgi:beta-lactamase regulating signal transducer with metallopeptidase domain